MEDINLSNFDDPQFQRSKYILTSPRSLRACANIGIKPLELLPQSFSEFSRSTCGICIGLKGTSLSVVYKEYERQRRDKLTKAKKERQRLIIESKPSSQNISPIRKIAKVSSPRSQTPLPTTMHSSSPALTMTIHTRSSVLPLKDQRILDALLRKKQHELELWSSPMTNDSSTVKFERASLNKEMLDEIKHLNIKAKNYDKEKRFKQNKSFVDEEKRQNEDFIREQVKHKEDKVDDRLQFQNSLREEEGKWRKKKQQLKEKQIKLAVEDLEAEIEEWRQSVDEINKANMSRALETSQRLLFEKKYLLQQKAKEREIAHKHAMTRIQEDGERTRECNLQEIAQKDERINNLMRQKAEQSIQALKIAQYTAQLRESIKGSSFLSDSFKEGVLYAQQHDALESKKKLKKDPERHSSSVTFG